MSINKSRIATLSEKVAAGTATAQDMADLTSLLLNTATVKKVRKDERKNAEAERTAKQEKRAAALAELAPLRDAKKAADEAYSAKVTEVCAKYGIEPATLRGRA